MAIDIPKNPDAGEKTTVSFRAAKSLIERFDRLAKSKGYDRTGLLLYLIRQAVDPDAE